MPTSKTRAALFLGHCASAQVPREACNTFADAIGVILKPDGRIFQYYVRKKAQAMSQSENYTVTAETLWSSGCTCSSLKLNPTAVLTASEKASGVHF